MGAAEMDDILEKILKDPNVVPTHLPFVLIEQITDSFSEERKIGSGGYGEVYKGELKSGVVIAVKRLYHIQGRRDKDFHAEFRNLMRVRHQNVVRFIGYCHESRQVHSENNGEYYFSTTTEKVLCFEYLQKGSLEDYIFDENRGPDWHTRYKIIKGICEGLQYLHEGLEKPMYHLDLKPANILLDINMEPKIADLGLSRLFDGKQTVVTEKFSGTLGYMPPEFVYEGKMSDKTDIYSLGVIIMQVMVGRDRYTREEMSSQGFTEIVHKNWRSKLQATLNSVSLEMYCQQVHLCADLALNCMEVDRRKRPVIQYIVQKLNEKESLMQQMLASLESTNGPAPPLEKLSLSPSFPEETNSYKELLKTDPVEEIRFPFVKLEKESSASLKLTNVTDKHVAFMLMATSGKVWMNYWAAPRSRGILPPRSTWEIVLNMVPLKEAPPASMRCEKRVILRSIVVREGLTPVDLTVEMFRHLPSNDDVREVRLDTVLVPPPPSSLDEEERPGNSKNKEGLAVAVTTVPAAPAPSSSSVRKVLDVSPTVLEFPLQPNKSFSCSLQLHNGSEERPVAFRLILEKKQAAAGRFFRILPHHGIVQQLSSCTVLVIVTTPKEEELPRLREFHLILQSAFATADFNQLNSNHDISHPFDHRMSSLQVHEMTIRVVYDPHASTSSTDITALLDVYPSELRFPFKPDTLVRCPLQLTNITDGDVPFCVMTTSSRNDDDDRSGGRETMYLHGERMLGVLPPRSTCALLVTLKEQPRPPPELDEIAITATTSGMVHEVKALKAVVVSDAAAAKDLSTAAAATTQIKHKRVTDFTCIDVHPTEPWILTGHTSGYVYIWNYKTKAMVIARKVTKEQDPMSYGSASSPVCCAMFIAERQWIVVGDGHGYIHVRTCPAADKVRQLQAHGGAITSLSVHPTRSCVLSTSMDCQMKMWDWNKDWACTRDLWMHATAAQRQVAFNPMDAGETFVAVSTKEDGGCAGAKIWGIHTPNLDICFHEECTSVEYYPSTSNDQQYLVTGCTQGDIKIWDLQEEICVRTLRMHQGSDIDFVVCHPKLPILVSGTEDGTVCLWNTGTYRLEKMVYSTLGAVKGLRFIDIGGSTRLIVGHTKGIEMVDIKIPGLEETHR